MWALLLTAVLLACGSSGNSSNTTLSDAIETCEALPHGLWSRTLEDWATSTHVQSSDRHGKIPINYKTDYEGQNIKRIKGLHEPKDGGGFLKNKLLTTSI